MAVDKAKRMKAVGLRLRDARQSQRPKLSIRSAADKAGISESSWRALELGVRRPAKGVEVPVSPLDVTLRNAALAVGLDPAEVFKLAGRNYDGTSEATPVPPSLEERVNRLEDQVARLHQLVLRLPGTSEDAARGGV